MSRRSGLVGLTALNACVLFLLMAYPSHVPFGIYLGLFALSLVAFGLCSLLQVEKGHAPAQRDEAIRVLRKSYGYPLLLALFVCALYVPCAAHYGLWDPWESHYGEVAREIVARNDWISLWWAHELWFWSKPILLFWSEALSLLFFRVDVRPDHTSGALEIALRAPHLLFSLLAILASYFALSRIFSKRSALLAAAVLATTPMYYLIGHQAITDMPFVSTMTMALSMLMMALTEDSERRVRLYHVGRFVFSLRQVAFGVLFFITLPQIFYLLSRNVTIAHWPPFVQFQFDKFLYGSAGNSGIPGNPVHVWNAPIYSAPWFQPSAQALYWATGLGLIVWHLRHEMRAQVFYIVLFYVFCGLSFMAKGIPGFALPGLVALLYLVASKRWTLLLKGELHVALGMLIVAVVGLPWFVAMYMRHGNGFTDRLLIHDHINRLTAGVHGDTGSIRYFIEQLGYATFPWLAFAPFAAAVLSRRYREVEDSHKRQTVLLLGLWFFSAFTLFSAMITKFHHYIFPAVPPLALLIGLSLDQEFNEEPNWRDSLRQWGLAVLSVTCLVLGIGGMIGDVRGVIPPNVSAVEAGDWVLMHPWSYWLCALLITLGVAFFVRAMHRASYGKSHSAFKLNPLQVAGFWMLGIALVVFVGRDLAWKSAARPFGFERFAQLYNYAYDRPWPSYIDYRAILGGIATVATLVSFFMLFSRLRPTLTRMYFALAAFVCAFCLWVYVPDIAPHWSQKQLVARYYRLRQGPAEPLLAWQMNWKGENIYTSNRVYAFVDVDNVKFRQWRGQHTGKHVFLILETTRLENLKNLLKPSVVRRLSSDRDNNKFVLVSTTL